MSYSFNAKGATREALRAAVAEKMDETVKHQAAHARDRDAIMANFDNVLALTADPADGCVFSVSMSGSLSWSGTQSQDTVPLLGVTVSCAVWHTRME